MLSTLTAFFLDLSFHILSRIITEAHYLKYLDFFFKVADLLNDSPTFYVPMYPEDTMISTVSTAL